ncbi:MAG: hypothetical protein ABSB78_00475 [Bacteroidota bacterium]
MNEPRPMFEEEMTAINQALVAATILDAETISLLQVQRSVIPPTIKTYFKSEVRQWLKEERTASSASKRFNYNLPEIQSLQQQIDMLLVSRFVFDRDDFLATLDKSIHFYFNYLLRPEWTLINFLFNQKSTESIHEILFKLTYCSEYLYFNEILEQYFTEKGIVSIRVDEFRLLIQKIDDRVVQTHNSIELARLTTPIFDFLNFGKTDHKDEVTIDALIIFFDDKRLDAIRARLEKEKMLQGVKEISVWQLATIIEKIRSGNEDASVEMEKPSSGVAEEEKQPSHETEMIEMSEEPPAAEITPEALAQPPSETKKPVEKKIQKPTPTGPESQRRKSVKAFDEGGVIEKKEPKLLDLRKSIDPSEQKRIIKKIFKRNEVEYSAAILKLNKIHTWKEAAAFLDEIFITNDIDPDSKDAMRFADLIYTRYPESRTD